MTAANFQNALKEVLKYEGGNDDDPDDHGGRTSRGITQREYTAWLAEYKRPDADVWQASQADIDQIYYDGYWQPLCDSLPTPIDFLYFNMNVNAGPHQATLLLQRALGVAKIDGRIGPVTRAAITAADPKSFVLTFKSICDTFYSNLGQPKFLQGWLNRDVEVQQAALAMIEGTYK
jgi:lysozyme family protein